MNDMAEANWYIQQVIALGKRNARTRYLKEQDNKCAICKQPIDSSIKAPCIDHDHNTGKVRGVLCHHCNVGLGMFKDSPEALKNAIQYLDKAAKSKQ